MKTLFGAAACLATLVCASSAFADRFVVLGASDIIAYAANIDARADRPGGVTRFEIETARYFGRQAQYLIITEEADCAKGRYRLISTHAMTSPTFEASPPTPGIPEWVTPAKGTMEEAYVQAGCAPSFPKASVVDTGEGDHDYRPVLEAAMKAHLGLKPTDPMPSISRKGR